MRNYAVIGDPVEHSRSPGIRTRQVEFHHLGSPYGKYHVRPAELGRFVEFAKRELAGFNCTVPHKAAIIPYLDEVDPDALAAESVNTVTVAEDGRLSGTSTDGYAVSKWRSGENFGAGVEGRNSASSAAAGRLTRPRSTSARRGAGAIRIANRTVEKGRRARREIAETLPALTLEPPRRETAGRCRAGSLERMSSSRATSLGLKPGDPPAFRPRTADSGSETGGVRHDLPRYAAAQTRERARTARRGRQRDAAVSGGEVV